jgi:outer membrane protein insertion porin family
LNCLIRYASVLLVLLVWAAPAEAQIQPCSTYEISTNLPPAGSAPVYRCAQIIVHPAGDRVAEVAPIVAPETYQYYLRAEWSARSESKFPAYAESAIQADFWNLWRTNFLEDLWVEVIDEPYENGVVGKHVIFHMEERARVKIVDYVPAEEGEDLEVDISKIETTLRENDIEVRLDSFVDEATLRQVIGVIRALYAEQGFNDAVVVTEKRELPGGPKLLHLTFRIDPGPKVEIAEIVFEGNEAFDDGTLRKQMKNNKTKNRWIPFLSDTTYREERFAEDADRIAEHYRTNGYATVQVGQPRIEVLRTSPDNERRWIRLNIPIDEGQQYTIGTFELTGESTLNKEAIRTLFEIQEGDTYSSEKLREGLERAKEVFGAYGFWQFSTNPELQPRGIDPETGQPIGDEPPPPVMDIAIELIEGKRFTVNRITFVGNTNTHDSVIRREMRVAEGGVFNAEALKEGVRRINQLGYFQPINLEQPAAADEVVQVTPTPGSDDQVDIQLKVEEQNRNQITFGAGVSQFDGFFGQLSFQTSNFLGRGETVGVSLQKGSLAQQYQLSFSEPYLFERPITVGADVFSREYAFPLQYTQRASGSNWVFGFPLADYTRGFLTYSYQQVSIKDVNPVYLDPAVLNSSPYLQDSLLLDQGGKRVVSKITPSLIYNTVNQPIFPSAGTRYTASLDVAGLGGNTSYLHGRLEGIWYKRLTQRTSFGLRAETAYIRPYGETNSLPIFEKLFSGGEYTVRGFDLRAISPRDPRTGVLVGGNKMVNLNAEYYIDMFGQVRLVLFYDAGQVRDIGEKFSWQEPITRIIGPEPPTLFDIFGVQGLLTERDAFRSEVIGQRSAFKTSTGFEVRFMMPVLNVPFRLIGAYNPQRGGVLDNQLQPAKAFTFRFAVGTTF